MWLSSQVCEYILLFSRKSSSFLIPIRYFAAPKSTGKFKIPGFEERSCLPSGLSQFLSYGQFVLCSPHCSHRPRISTSQTNKSLLLQLFKAGSNKGKKLHLLHRSWVPVGSLLWIAFLPMLLTSPRIHKRCYGAPEGFLVISL